MISFNPALPQVSDSPPGVQLLGEIPQKDTYRLELETAAQLPSTHLISIFSNRETRSTVKTS